MNESNRRNFLSGSGVALATVFAGCSGLSTAEEDDQDEPETTERPVYEPDPETEDDVDWQGGYRRSEERWESVSVYTDELRVRVPFAYAHMQLGVYFGDPVDGNPHDIDNEEFEWIEAGNGSYIWTPYVEIRSESNGYWSEPDNLTEAVPPETWTATEATEGSGDVLPLSTGFDEPPIYYRRVQPEGTHTSPAYMYPEQHDDRYLAFEITDRATRITFDSDVRADWTFGF